MRSAANQRIEVAKNILIGLESTKREAQASLENAFLDGRATNASRNELLKVEELFNDAIRDIEDATNQIANCNKRVDEHRADQIYQHDAEVVAAMCKPFDDFLRNIS